MNCNECNKKMVPTTIRYEFKHEDSGITLKAINVPAMKCQECHTLHLDNDIKEKIVQCHMHYPKEELLDYQKCTQEIIARYPNLQKNLSTQKYYAAIAKEQ